MFKRARQRLLAVVVCITCARISKMIANSFVGMAFMPPVFETDRPQQ